MQEIPHVTRDNVGRIIPTTVTDQWEGRVGVAYVFGQLGALLEEEIALELLKAIIPLGLEDPKEEVRSAMQEAAIIIINTHGAVSTCRALVTNHSCFLHFQTLSDSLMQHFEGCLRIAGSNEGADLIRKAVVVLMGSLASHMDKHNPKA